MSFDPQVIIDGFLAGVPFARHVGVGFEHLEPGRCVVRLPDEEHLRNHIASQHAGALFTAAETASGVAFLSEFADLMGEATPVVQDASIRYTKVARGPIDAEARVDGAAALRSTYAAEGVVRFPIDVALRDRDGDTVATVTVNWHLRRNEG